MKIKSANVNSKNLHKMTHHDKQINHFIYSLDKTFREQLNKLENDDCVEYGDMINIVSSSLVTFFSGAIGFIMAHDVKIPAHEDFLKSITNGVYETSKIVAEGIINETQNLYEIKVVV